MDRKKPAEEAIAEVPTQSLPRMWLAIYTMPSREFVICEQLESLALGEVFLPELVNIDEQLYPSRAERLLFKNYVFLNTENNRETIDRLKTVEGVRRVLGSDDSRPSSIDEQDIRVLKTLCESARHPELGPIPLEGQMARIVRGPLEGAKGFVKGRKNKMILLAFSIPIIAGSYELNVPENDVEIFEHNEPEKKTHRGGRRMHRHFKNKNNSKNNL